MIGLNSDPLVNRELRSEADKYSDLIQFGFIDHYYNLTLKSISMLRWAKNNCPTIAYIVKSDDDVMINVENLMNKLNEFKSGITGLLMPITSRLPIRQSDGELNYYKLPYNRVIWLTNVYKGVMCIRPYTQNA